jgi:2'-5' RNA ligase
VRLFVAVWPDADTRLALAELRAELGTVDGLGFVREENWHVTLRFLGDVPDEVVPALAGALEVLRTAGAAQCQLGPATAWFGRSDVLQIPASGLDQLASAVEEATEPLVPVIGAGATEEGFTGHLTLARRKKRRPPPPFTEEAVTGLPFARTFAVDEVCLVSSRPEPDGHRYVNEARVRLV